MLNYRHQETVGALGSWSLWQNCELTDNRNQAAGAGRRAACSPLPTPAPRGFSVVASACAHTCLLGVSCRPWGSGVPVEPCWAHGPLEGLLPNSSNCVWGWSVLALTCSLQYIVCDLLWSRVREGWGETGQGLCRPCWFSSGRWVSCNPGTSCGSVTWHRGRATWC